MYKTTFLLFLLLLFFLPAAVQAQIQIGVVKGVVSDPTGARIPGATLNLSNPITGLNETRISDPTGEFTFNNLTFATYLLRVEAPGFEPDSRSLRVESNLPLTLQLRLSAANVSATVGVKSDLAVGDSASSETELYANSIQRTAGATRSLALQRLVATTPGWTTQNNGLMHIRGVEDGALYIVNGIPTVDRLDALSASNFDTEMINSLNVITGNIPAEFGGRTGAVIQIQPKSGIDAPFSGSFGMSRGSFGAGELTASAGGSLHRRFGLFGAASTSRSDRFLDPVDLGNFNNRGGTGKFNLRGDWHPNERNIVLFDLATNGTDFHVNQREEQEEAGQHQRQELRDNAQAASWQRLWSSSTVSNLAWYRRGYRSMLFGSENDTPIFAEQDRRHARHGFIASLTKAVGKHTFKFGVEATRITPREYFSFAITDEEEAEEFDISEPAQEFDLDNPFVFRDRRTGTTTSAYVQDVVSPVRNLKLTLGLRFDRSTLPVTDFQFSPRLGFVYHMPTTRTAIRASFNRLYMPPQIENLLLADSPQARALSPFADDTAGGVSIRPEKMSAYEVGVAQDVRGWFKLDVAWWHRKLCNFSDPNVFFGTTIVFPNSVAEGFARGLDARLELPLRGGWSGYLNYTNARILQTGPINGGLFLTDEFIEIGPGTRFIPDHDQRNVGSFGLTYTRRNWWASLSGRHESGVGLEVEAERLEELKEMPGAELVNFDRRRVRPWTLFDFSAGVDLRQDQRFGVSLQFDLQNFSNTRFAYNFGNPFEGTHFGYPRLLSGRVKFTFR
jgi:TonB dependent receptor/Carboxypeptidase regulatory-like domain/TonB-dependent Receptor Plug Domain